MHKRKPLNKTIKKRGLILCEGETEVIYFFSLVSHPNNKRNLSGVNVDIYKPKDHSPKGLVNEAKDKIRKAKKEENPFDFVWLVFDKDGHANLHNTFNEIETAKVTPKINYAFSITCFEYFILLHFEKTTKPFRKCDDIVSVVENYITDYKKAANIYSKLLELKDTAFKNCDFVLAQVQNDIDRGCKIHELSYYCNIHKLVQYLESLS